ncbi:hypothetical protein F4808DRAFT_424837, partial [Astrocystis sublimbata]
MPATAGPELPCLLMLLLRIIRLPTTSQYYFSGPTGTMPLVAVPDTTPSAHQVPPLMVRLRSICVLELNMKLLCSGEQTINRFSGRMTEFTARTGRRRGKSTRLHTANPPSLGSPASARRSAFEQSIRSTYALSFRWSVD